MNILENSHIVRTCVYSLAYNSESQAESLKLSLLTLMTEEMDMCDGSLNAFIDPQGPGNTGSKADGNLALIDANLTATDSITMEKTATPLDRIIMEQTLTDGQNMDIEEPKREKGFGKVIKIH